MSDINGPEEYLLANPGRVINGVMSRETYAASIGYSAEGKPLSTTARFDQGLWWRRRDESWVRIAHMSPEHRYNTAAMLMRNASLHAFRYAWGFADDVAAHDGGDMAHDALEHELDRISEKTVSDPRGWLRETALYKTLTLGLTVHGDGTEPWEKTGRDPVAGEPRS